MNARNRCTQMAVSTRYEQRLDDGNLRNYGRMVVDLAAAVPDGLVVFFVSYSYMDYVIARWHEEGLLAQLMEHKLIFIETQARHSRAGKPARCVCMRMRRAFTALSPPRQVPHAQCMRMRRAFTALSPPRQVTHAQCMRCSAVASPPHTHTHSHTLHTAAFSAATSGCIRDNAGTGQLSACVRRRSWRCLL